MNEEAKVYLSCVEEFLSHTSFKKKRFIREFSDEVCAACEENNGVTYSDLCHLFGEPEAIAKQIAGYSPSALKKPKDFNLKRALVAIVVAAVIAVCGAIGVLFAIEKIYADKPTPVYVDPSVRYDESLTGSHVDGAVYVRLE